MNVNMEELTPTPRVSALFEKLLWFLRSQWGSNLGHNDVTGLTNDYVVLSHEETQKIIARAIDSEMPFMAARFGTVELESMLWARYFKCPYYKYYHFISGSLSHWNCPKYLFDALENNAGFFPATRITLEQFTSLMISDCQQVDILGSWQKKEKFFWPFLRNAKLASLGNLDPDFTGRYPWSASLEGKKVLVIHPFEASIKLQYAKRTLLFPGTNILPDFELKTLKAVQSIARNKTDFTTWFEALNYMKNRASSIDFDVAIIGCGAYGFPLAAHVKRIGKVAIHLGGSTQLLFGIFGKRWEDMAVRSLFNEHWTRPLPEDRPHGLESVENGVYW